MGNRYERTIDSHRDELGALVGGLQADVKELKDSAQKTTGRPLNAPEIDATVTPTFRLNKKRTSYFVTLGFKGPAEMVSLTVRMVATAKRVDQPTFNQNKFEGHVTEFDDQQRADLGAGGTVIAEVDALLDPATQYDVFRLVSFFEDGSAVDTPSFTVAYNDPPLFQFTTPASTANAPSKPTLARIVGNSVDENTDGVTGSVTLRIYADETQVLTFAQQGTDSVQARVVKVSDGLRAPSPPVIIDDPSVTFVDVVIGDLQIGREYDWIRNTAFSTGDAANAPATSTVGFFAGGYRDPSDGLALLTLTSYTGTPTESNTQLLLDLELVQPTPPYRLKNANLERSKSGGAFVDQNVNFGLQDPIYNTPGTIHLFRTVDVHPTRTYQYRETIKAVGGVTKQFTSGSIVAASSLQLAASDTAGGGGSSYVDGGSMLYSLQQFEVQDGSTPSAGDDLFLGRAFFVQNSVTTRIDSKAASTGGSLDNFGLQWRVDEGRLMLNTDVFTKTGTPAFKLKKLMRAGDVWSFTSLWIGDAGVTLPSFAIALVDQNSGDIVVTPAVSFTISGTDQSPFFAFLVIPDAYHMDGNQWLEIRPGSNPSSKIYTANWMLSRNAGYLNWQAHPDEMKMIEPQAGAVSSQGEGMVANDFTVFSTDGREFNKDGIVSGGISPQ